MLLFRKKWMSFHYLKHLRGKTIFLNNILRKLYLWAINFLVAKSLILPYYLRQYNVATKLMLVCDWKKERSLHALAKIGETICGGELL